MSVFLMLSLVVLLGMILVLIGLGLSKKLVYDREKMSPFECGFTPKSSPRLPLSLRFYLIAVIFLIFDVELVLVFPVILAFSGCEFSVSAALLLIFLVILLGGLYHEANQGSLSWSSW